MRPIETREVSGSPSTPGRHRRSVSNWAALVERVLGDWQATLRTSVLLVIVGAITIAGLAVAAGAGGERSGDVVAAGAASPARRGLTGGGPDR